MSRPQGPATPPRHCIAKTGHGDPASAPGMAQNIVLVLPGLGSNAQRSGEDELRHLVHRANQFPQGSDDDDG